MAPATAPNNGAIPGADAPRNDLGPILVTTADFEAEAEFIRGIYKSVVNSHYANTKPWLTIL
jgi:hypothetical protein